MIEWFLANSETPNWALIVLFFFCFGMLSFGIWAVSEGTRMLEEAQDYYAQVIAMLGDKEA